MVGLRWDGDERGEGVADATGFVAGVLGLVDAMRSPSWVAEEPGVHLLPHIERACRTLPLEIEDARLSADGSFDVRLSWRPTRATAAAGRRKGASPGTDTLVFVVDILDSY